MILLILFAFFSGIVTIFAPCIWPILPIVLSAGVSGGERKPIGIVIGLSVSFMLITLLLASVVKVIPFDPDSLRYFAVVIIAILGLTLVVPALGARLETLVSRLGGLGGRFTKGSGTGFWGGFVTGFALGLVWSPCAGPILATVATLAATQAVSFQVVLITFAFVSGVAVPLFVLAILGQKILTKTRILSRYSKVIQQGFGVIMILAAFAIFTGYDRTLQTKLLGVFPGYGNFLSGFEDNAAVQRQLDVLKRPNVQKPVFSAQESPKADTGSGLPEYGSAPEFSGIAHWLNTDKPLSMQDLRGKVVLVDFWTYSCINCIRTLPHVTDWYEKYKDQGFVVVGVHTPEFEFEKKTANVKEALVRYGIRYPVAQDNAFGTWTAYDNHYWPAHYLIDAKGIVRQYHFGEGKYAETEQAIRKLLTEAGRDPGNTTIPVVSVESSQESRTPETYLGSARMERFVSPERVRSGKQSFTIPSDIGRHAFAYAGDWTIESERALAQNDARLELHFEGGKVFLVMAPPDPGVLGIVHVFLDGAPVGTDFSGKDVSNGVVAVDADRLYELLDFGAHPGDHRLELRFETPGTAVYAFTFS